MTNISEYRRPWTFYRFDHDDGQIVYEGLGPYSSRVSFEGPRAIDDVKAFIKAVAPYATIEG
jgi:hypothetical protein